MGVTFSYSTYAVNRKSLLVKSNLLPARCNSKSNLQTLASWAFGLGSCSTGIMSVT